MDVFSFICNSEDICFMAFKCEKKCLIVYNKNFKTKSLVDINFLKSTLDKWIIFSLDIIVSLFLFKNIPTEETSNFKFCSKDTLFGCFQIIYVCSLVNSIREISSGSRADSMSCFVISKEF